MAVIGGGKAVDRKPNSDNAKPNSVSAPPVAAAPEPVKVPKTPEISTKPEPKPAPPPAFDDGLDLPDFVEPEPIAPNAETTMNNPGFAELLDLPPEPWWQQPGMADMAGAAAAKMAAGPSQPGAAEQGVGAQVQGGLLEQFLALANAYQIPRDMVAEMVAQIAGAAASQLTGEVPLPTGEPGRPFTPADAYQAAGQNVNAIGSAGTLMMPGGKAAQTLMASGKGARGITAYHGSPHDFDKFDFSYRGTGEGAAAYGEGGYFAESPMVARSYQAQSKGRLYEVNIKANKDDFLDYDKPLSEQNDAVRKAIKESGVQTDDVSIRQVGGGWQIFVNDAPASTVYNRRIDAERTINSGVRTSTDMTALNSVSELAQRHEVVEQLRKAGIPGIKYLDQGSRGSGQGTYNYVVFDENLIEITKKLGIAMPLPNSFPGYDKMTEEQRKSVVVITELDMERLRNLDKEIY